MDAAVKKKKKAVPLKHVCLQLNDQGSQQESVSDCSDLLDISVTREAAALVELSAKL